MNRSAAFAAFRQAAGHEADAAVFAPGRVNLIGEHTDDHEGFAMPMAIERGVALAGRRVHGDAFTLYAAEASPAQSSREAGFAPAEPERGKAWKVYDRCVFQRGQVERDPEHAWADHFKAVVWALANRGLAVPVCEAVITSDLPLDKGLSAPVACAVASLLLLKKLGALTLSPVEMAKLAREGENGFVGIARGMMDPMASTFAEKGRALFLDCRSLARESIALPAGLTVVVVDSGVRCCPDPSELDRRRAECAEGVRLLAASLPHVRALRDVGPGELAALLGDLPAPVGKRCRHVVSENVRVGDAVAAMRGGDRAALKALLASSHASLRDDYQVSGNEVDALVDLALGLPFCHGARLTGAGFGGSTVNLVDSAAVESFADEIRSGYHARCGRSADIHVFEPGEGAHILVSGPA